MKIPSIGVCVCIQARVLGGSDSLTAAPEEGSITLVKQLLSQQTNTQTHTCAAALGLHLCIYELKQCVCVYAGYCLRL